MTIKLITMEDIFVWFWEAGLSILAFIIFYNILMKDENNKDEDNK